MREWVKKHFATLCEPTCWFTFVTLPSAPASWLPDDKKVAIGEGLWAAQAADSLDKACVCYTWFGL